MRLKNFILIALLQLVTNNLSAQDSLFVSLDSCRAMALTNNTQLQIRKERIKSASYNKKESFAAYLPAIDFAGGYVYNQKELAIFGSDQLLPTKTFNPETGKYEFNIAKNPINGEPIKAPNGQYIPETIALIPKEAMTYDIHNLFFGAVTVTQPIYMGGKIMAMNRITQYAETLAKTLHDADAENIIFAVDASYWQIISLSAKLNLSKSYVNLLDTLMHNVQAMYNEGIATKSDILSVKVKLNQAQVDLVKVENGLSLSRMALAQLCGLPANTYMKLADEEQSYSKPIAPVASNYNMNEIFARRKDIKALELGIKIQEQKQRIALSSMLPNIAVTGSYSFSNPNMYDGFRKRFDGAFSIGATITIPIWHWGGNYNKYQAAKTEVNISRLTLADAQEKIELQVSQASFKTHEAIKTYQLTVLNLEHANENLRMAQAGFKEGVLSTDNVMEAQTAWLKAYSENIDAEIDVQLCDVYLSKALGILY